MSFAVFSAAVRRGAAPVASAAWVAAPGAAVRRLSGGAKVPIAAIKELRAVTGAPMMECKSALSDPEVNGDLTAAVDWLRKKGVTAASKKAGRSAGEGLVGVALAADGLSAAMVEINSETDFVARNDVFQGLVRRVSAAALATLPGTGATDGAAALEQLQNATVTADDATTMTVADAVVDCVAKVRENVVLRRVAVVEAPPGGFIAPYVHNQVAPSLGTLGAVLGFTVAPGAPAGSDAAGTLAGTGKTLAMHTAAAAPRYLSRDDVPQADLDHEREFLVEEALNSGKPEAIVQRMVDGRMKKFYQEYCLIEQECMIGEDKRTISDMLDAAAKETGMDSVQLTGFARFKCGETSLEETE